MKTNFNQKVEKKSDVESFWKKCNKPFQGDLVSPLIIKLSKNYIGSKVLDVGAGSGALLDLLPNAVGIDIAPKHERVKKGDITKIDFESETFDTVFATEVLEHLSEIDFNDGVGEVFRVLKKGGNFIITVPFNENLTENSILCPKCGEYFHKWGHLQSFSVEKMKKMIESNGFEVVKTNTLSLGSIARHPVLKYFAWFLKIFGYFKPANLFIIAIKNKN